MPSNSLPEIFLKHHSYFKENDFPDSFTLKDLLGSLRPYIIINESKEKLVSIEEIFKIFSPHPYLKEGAIYSTYSPWHLRESVVSRLIQAEKNLNGINPNYYLKIFDGYRENIDLSAASPEEMEFLISLVDSIWARPSISPNPPPPHSTGGTVDLTICDLGGSEIDMGSEIDEVSKRSLPNYYKGKNDINSITYHTNRELLRTCMEDAGFYRLSHEWWHFSYGDQVWAVFESFRIGELVGAIYGEVEETSDLF